MIRIVVDLRNFRAFLGPAQAYRSGTSSAQAKEMVIDRLPRNDTLYYCVDSAGTEALFADVGSMIGWILGHEGVILRFIILQPAEGVEPGQKAQNLVRLIK